MLSALVFARVTCQQQSGMCQCPPLEIRHVAEVLPSDTVALNLGHVINHRGRCICVGPTLVQLHRNLCGRDQSICTFKNVSCDFNMQSK